MCLASILGNVLVIYVIKRYSELQTTTNIFIHNLALTDVFVATLNMPFWITSLYTRKWNLSQEWCEVSASLQHTMGSSSLFIMGLIAMNRNMKVVKGTLYIKFFPSKKLLGCTAVSSGWLLCYLPHLRCTDGEKWTLTQIFCFAHSTWRTDTFLFSFCM